MREHECDGDDSLLRHEVATEAGGSHPQCVQDPRQEVGERGR